MRKIAVLSAFVIGLCPLFVSAYTNPLNAQSASGEPFDPQTVLAGAPTNYVNDFADVLSAETELQLNTELRMFEASTSNQIAVAVVPDLGGDYIENYAQALFKDWGIGSKQRDNGVLLLLAVEDRKNRIEVGYGLEGALPDSIADSILREMTTDLRAGNYDAAIVGAVRSIESATRNEYVGSGTTESGGGEFPFEFFFVAVIFAFQFLAAILGRTKSWWLGGVLGAAAGGGISYFLLPSLLLGGALTLALILIGLAIDYFVSMGYHSYHDSGRTPPWFFGGPSSGSGFGGGGGFGGFGGGRSGGGGSSGSW